MSTDEFYTEAVRESELDENPVGPALPDAVRDLLMQVRAEIRRSKANNPDIRVSVKMGWPEVRAIYALHNALGKARASRDAVKGKLKKTSRTLEQSRADVDDYELLNNRALLGLLVDVERAMSGKETNADAAFATHRRLKAFIARARRADRRKTR